jgi:translation initiation factor IF-2
MDKETEHKQQKLVLNTTKLSLKKPVDASTLRQSFVTSKTQNVTVEIKKSKLPHLTLSKGHDVDQSSGATHLTSTEFHKRLDVVRRAAAEEEASPAASSSSNELIGTLSDFGIEMPTEPIQKEISNIAPQTEDLSHTNKKHTYANKNHLEAEDVTEKKTDDKTPTSKLKQELPKKLNKTAIFSMLDNDQEDGPVRTRSLASIKRARAKEKRKMQDMTPQEKVYREVILPETIAVSEFANRMTERTSDVIRELMKLGIIANAGHIIDADTAELVSQAFGHTVKRIQESDVENILTIQDEDHLMVPRAPVVTVMGHVDHGKTSLLDALKSTDVVSGEAGGITQHIGAYRVTLPSKKAITFIDTPGHEAFTEMRTRGAKVTDIVVLVVAADDGIKPQTIEAINHAKAANVPIIVAINKIDKPGANIEKVKTELLHHNLVSEDLGGDVIVVPVSALKKQNLDKLEEAILLLAEMADLKANTSAPASGTVIESKIDKGKGAIASILVQRGTLKIGDLVVAGETFGRVKRMANDKGHDVTEVTPSEPVEIFGLDASPMAGDPFAVVQTEKQARDITEYRARRSKDNKISIAPKGTLEDLFLKASGNSTIQDLPIIVKGDVQGSIEAIIGSITKISTDDEIKIKVLHSAVGGITGSDVQLAHASGALVIGFNVRASNDAAEMASKLKIDMRYYSIIYNIVDDMKAIMSGMLTPIIHEEYIGSVAIRQVFNITKVGKIAGSYVTKGIIKRGAGVRLLRDDIVIHEGTLKTLKRFKDDVKEVREGFECGIAFENYDDIKEGDTVEVFEKVEEKRTL